MADAVLPEQVSAVVIGGGAMGCSTLYHLAASGVDAILLERHQVGSGTTWHSAAQVRALRSDPGLTALVRYSIDLYKALESETGQSTGWIGAGSLSIACNPDRLEHIRRQQALARSFGVQAVSITPGEAAERWPWMRVDDVLGAVWSPEDGRVGPTDLCASLIRGARSRGARVFEDTAVTGILTRGGRVAGVETGHGLVRTNLVAVCAGLWSRRVAGMANVDVPLAPCEHFYLLTSPVAGLEGNLPTLSDHDSRLYIRDDSGGLLIGCFEPAGKPVDPEQLGENFAFQLLPEDWDHFAPMMDNAMHRVPVLRDIGARMLLNGPESFTPDGNFLLGEAAETAGLFLGCGMNSVGVASAGGAGKALAEIISRGRASFELGSVDARRFGPEWNDVAALASRASEVLGTHYQISCPGVQWRSARNLRSGPLQATWKAERAFFHQHGGWERPAWFGHDGSDVQPGFGRPAWHDRVESEVMAADGGAALFDASTFGKIRVEGPDAEAFLDGVCTNNMRRRAGRVIYTGMLNEDGGYESDLVAYRLSDDCYRLHVGTTALKRDLAWLRRHAGEARVNLVDESDHHVILALTGRAAGQIAPDLCDIARFDHRSVEIAGIPVRAARLSYVGGEGWELTCGPSDALALYRFLRDAGAVPAGLLAQTSMRIEQRHLAFGRDLDAEVTPLEAGLAFTIDWTVPFIGREALQRRVEAGPPDRLLVSLIVDDVDAVLLGNEPILQGSDVVGRATSAAFGYRVGRPVALGYVSRIVAEDGCGLAIDIAGTARAVRVCTDPAISQAGLAG